MGCYFFFGVLQLICSVVLGGLQTGGVGRGLHSFPYPLNLSFLCPFPLHLT